MLLEIEDNAIVDIDFVKNIYVSEDNRTILEFKDNTEADFGPEVYDRLIRFFNINTLK